MYHHSIPFLEQIIVAQLQRVTLKK